MTDDAFAAWAEKTRTASGQLDWQGYETLLKPSIVNEPVLYSSFDPDLFNKIIASFAPEQHKMASTHNKHHGHHQAEANQ